MTERGVVLSVKGKYAEVRVGRNSACAACGKCGMTENQKHVDFYASNVVNAQEGDGVVLEIPETNTVGLAFVGYIIPIIPALILLVLSICMHWQDWLGILLFFVGLVFGYAIVAMIEKIKRHKWMAEAIITDIVYHKSQNIETNQQGEDKNE